MATGTIRKFSFSDFCDFEQDVNPRAKAAEPVEGPPPVFSEADLNAARAQSHAEGRAVALAEIEQSAAERLAIAAERIAVGITALEAAEAARGREFQLSALQIGVAALRKILPDLSRRFGQREIELVTAEIVAAQLDEPRIVVRVADQTFDKIRDHVDGLAAKQGYAGKLVLITDPRLGAADLRAEWADGGAERLAERTLSDISDAIARLAQTAEATNSPVGNPTD